MTYETPVGANMFAYCGNNPVNMSDYTGKVWHIALGAILGGTANLAVNAINNFRENKSITEGASVAFLTGAISGGVAATGYGLGVQVAVAAGTAAIDGWSGFQDDIDEKGVKTAIVNYGLAIGSSAGLAALSGGTPAFSSKHATKIGKQVVTRTVNAYKHGGISSMVDEGIDALRWFGKRSKGIRNAIWQNAKGS